MVDSYEIPELPVDGREGLVLFFTVGSHTFGIRLTDVVHIEPLVREAFEGSLDDDVILKGKGPGDEDSVVINLRRFLEIESESSRDEAILVLFKSGDDMFGMVADEVEAIVTANEVPELAFPRLLGEEGRMMYDGFFNRDSKLILALSPFNIRESLAAYEAGND